jgi:ESCRT-II complex subunit VPS25
LFYNKKIGRRLGREDAREVVEFMRKDGRAEWVSGGKGEAAGGEFWVWWRNVEEWAGLIAEWVSCAFSFGEKWQRLGINADGGLGG